MDVADKNPYQVWIASAASELGGLDISYLTSKAGGGDMSDAGLAEQINVDLMGTTRDRWPPCLSWSNRQRRP